MFIIKEAFRVKALWAMDLSKEISGVFLVLKEKRRKMVSC
jgi:hypothetical protein